jgi:hypothetical protein
MIKKFCDKCNIEIRNDTEYYIKYWWSDSGTIVSGEPDCSHEIKKEFCRDCYQEIKKAIGE